MPEAPTQPSAQPRITIVDIFMLAAIFCAMLYGIGRYGLYEPHEGHFAGVGRAMVLGNDWITPRLNGAPYLNKPPLFYWMIASSYALFGGENPEWAVRLPQALIGFLGVLLAWRWARELFGPRAGRIAAGMLAVSAGWYLFAHQLLIDELLTIIYIWSLYCIWRITLLPESLRSWIWFYVSIGLSVMAKGLIGPALAVIVLLGYVWIKKDKRIVRNSRPWLGVLIVLAIVLPWLVMIELRNPGFLRYVLVNEHWNRIFDKRDPPDYEPVKKGVFVYLLISLVWLAPWCFFLPQIAAFARRNARAPAERERARAAAITILALGALVPTLLFIPVPSRLIYYSLPTLPAFVILAAGWWVSLNNPEAARARRTAALTALLLGIPIAIGGQFIAPLLGSIPDLAAAPKTLDYIPGFALTIGAGLAACGLLLLSAQPGKAMVALCACLLVGGAWNTKGFAEFDRVRSSRRLVSWLLPRATPETLWISEGSLEIGAAGGMSFNLGLDGTGNTRRIYVMSDSPKRNPPRFPGAPPEYLIDGKRLAELWASRRPIIYITDFQRMGEDDSIRLPPEPRHEIPFAPGDNPGGLRRVYVNEAARQHFGL